MAAAASGRVRNVHTLGEAYCNLIIACTNAGEWERAAEWCELVDEFARTHGATPLLGACRTVHADVLVSTGRWPEAEQALESALAAHRRYVPAMGAPTVAALAELRIRQGRLPEAEQLLGGPRGAPVLAARARPAAHGRGPAADGRALLERGLRAADGDAVPRRRSCWRRSSTPASPAATCQARAAARELAALAATSGIRSVAARAPTCRGGARRAGRRGRAADAAEPARRALAAFSRLGMPLDAARRGWSSPGRSPPARPDVAVEEARAAFAAFRELGASRADGRGRGGAAGSRRRHRRAPARLRRAHRARAGGARRCSPSACRTRRSRQTLVISEKTAGHHVSRILSKLGVHNRAEAAAYAARGA